MSIIEILRTLLLQFLAFVPNIIGSILVAMVGWILSRLLSKIVLQFLKGFGIDKLADKINEVDVVQKFNIKIQLSSLLSNIIYYFMMLIFMVAAAEVLNMAAISKLISDLIAYIPLALSACIVLFVGLLAADFIKNLVQSTLQSLNVPSAKMIANGIFYFIMLSVLMSALEQAKVNTGFITTNLSIILAGGVLAFALAYGFASKSTVANLIASMYNKQRYKLGMEVTIDNIRGTIIEMDNNNLVLRSVDSRVIIPLSRLAETYVEIHD